MVWLTVPAIVVDCTSAPYVLFLSPPEALTGKRRLIVLVLSPVARVVWTPLFQVPSSVLQFSALA